MSKVTWILELIALLLPNERAELYERLTEKMNDVKEVKAEEITVTELKKKLEATGKYKDSSVKVFIVGYNRIQKEVINSTNIEEIYKSIEKVKEHLENKYCNTSTQRTLLKSFGVCLNIINYDNKIENEFNKYVKDRTNKIDELKQLTPATEKEMTKYKSWEEIKKIANEMKQKYETLNNDINLFNYYISKIVIEIPPLRVSEYCNIEFEDNKTNNYYANKEIHLRTHKTQISRGERIIKVSDELDKLIQFVKEKFNNKCLMPSVKNPTKPATEANLSFYFNNIFGFSSMILRKVYISEVVDKMEPEKRKETAQIMGHTLATQMLTYTKSEFK